MVTASEPPPQWSHRKQAYEAKETFPSHPLLGQARTKAAEEWSSHHLFKSQHGTLNTTLQKAIHTTSIGLAKKV